MNNNTRSKSLLAIGLLGATMLTAAPALATQGFFPHAFGIKSKGLAGSDIAFAQDAMSIAINPAGLTKVGNQLNVGVSLFSPHRKFTASAGTFVGPQNTKSDKNLFPIPNFGVSYQLSDRLAVGLTMYGSGGMNTTYPSNAGPFGLGVFFNGKAGVDLSMLGISPAAAYKLTENVSIGVAPIFAISRFKAYGLSPTFTGFSSSPAALAGNGYDWAYGIGGSAGIDVDMGIVSFAANYQSRVYMSKFKKYSGLFAEGGDFDIPASASAGIAVKPMAGLTITGSYKRIWFSDVDAVGNSINNFLLGPPGFLGTSKGAGFGWKDVNVFAIGAQYDVTSAFTVRAGYAFNTQPIKKGEVMFNTLAPAVIQHHVTAGFSYDISDSLALDFAAMYATGKRSGTDSFIGGNYKLKMYQLEASAGISWKF
jgi:long-chain fatty acid transport protein